MEVASALQSLDIGETETQPPPPLRDSPYYDPKAPPSPSCSPYYAPPYYDPRAPPHPNLPPYPKPKPICDENLFNHIDYMHYCFTTCGSDGGKLFEGSVRKAHVDFTYDILICDQGVTVNGGPLRRFDDPRNHQFLLAIRNFEFPKELDPKDKDTKLHEFIVRREEKEKDKDPLDDLFTYPPCEISWFEAGTSKEKLAAADDPPNSYVIPVPSEDGETSYMLFKPPPEPHGGLQVNY